MHEGSRIQDLNGEKRGRRRRKEEEFKMGGCKKVTAN